MDVSSVIETVGMFSNSSFNGDISNWDVSSVTEMTAMFAESSFNGDISPWDVSSVTNMDGMFNANSSFNQNLSSWNVTNVSNCSLFRLVRQAGLFQNLILRIVLNNNIYNKKCYVRRIVKF